jgi:UMF1 family MFS transporter
MRTIRSLKHYRNIALYLLARMIYTDGKTAVLVFGGIYAVGNFSWDLLSTLIFGIILTIFAVLGGFVGGWMDDRIGSKKSILISIGGTIVGLVGELSITPHTLFFVIPWDPQTAKPVWDVPFFSTLPELLYVAVATLVAVFITAAYANSRTMLARLAPTEKMTEFFGLYSMSGLATTSLSSFSVAFFTAWFASQRAGYAAILIFLTIGFFLMLFVREERATLAA